MFFFFNEQLSQNASPLGESYAYLDSVEQIENKYYLRFDCVNTRNFGSRYLNSDIEQLDNFILEGIIDRHEFSTLLNANIVKYGAHLIESKWFIITVGLDNRVFEPFAENQRFLILSIRSTQLMSNYENENVLRLIKLTTLRVSEEEVIADLIQSINLIPLIDPHVFIYNVGQGNCNSIISEGIPQIYFDVGGGTGANSFTFPRGFTVNNSCNQPIILSHWDMDHIQLAVNNNDLFNSKWLVPVHSSISISAMKIANKIAANRNLICWGGGTIIFDGGHRIVGCTGRIGNKNNSGIAMYIKYADSSYVLLPGDASFQYIPKLPSGQISGLVASHHGSRGSTRLMPRSYGNAMLAYSFGTNNTHKHAHKTARNAYEVNGWITSRDTENGCIAMKRLPTDTSYKCSGLNCLHSRVQHF